MVPSHGSTAMVRSVMLILGYAARDVEVEPDRRVAQADFHVGVDEDAEVHGVDGEAHGAGIRMRAKMRMMDEGSITLPGKLSQKT